MLGSPGVLRWLYEVGVVTLLIAPAAHGFDAFVTADMDGGIQVGITALLGTLAILLQARYPMADLVQARALPLEWILVGVLTLVIAAAILALLLSEGTAKGNTSVVIAISRFLPMTSVGMMVGAMLTHVAIATLGGRSWGLVPDAVAPADGYDVGLVLFNKGSPGFCGIFALLCLGTVLTALIVVFGDMAAGLLNLAGLVSLASDAVLPPWNNEADAKGIGTKTSAHPEGWWFEANILGQYFETPVASVVPSANVRSSRSCSVEGELPGTSTRLGQQVEYIVLPAVIANAHAQIVNIRASPGFQGFSIEPQQEAREVARDVCERTQELITSLNGHFSSLQSVGDEEMRTVTAVIDVLTNPVAWEGRTAQRRRIQTLAIACAFVSRCVMIVDGLVGVPSTHIGHAGFSCGSPLHRWLEHRTAFGTFQEECEYVLVGPVNPPKLKTSHESWGREVWSLAQQQLTSGFINRGALMWCFLQAMQAADALVEIRDFFPSGQGVTRNTLEVADLKFGCSCRTMSDGALTRYSQASTWIACNRGGASLLPHPKTIFHVAKRVVHKALLLQGLVWAALGIRGLVQA